ncbi:MAG: hypothetical protein K0Q74_535 [Gammaproteobacteria bacterium]|jgi:hypothetical protein|nr:hypothetical protein [Gammaproteobacteria bacterium]
MKEPSSILSDNPPDEEKQVDRAKEKIEREQLIETLREYFPNPDCIRHLFLGEIKQLEILSAQAQNVREVISSRVYDMRKIESALSQSRLVAASTHLGRSLFHWVVDYYIRGDADLAHLGFVSNALAIENLLTGNLNNKDPMGLTPIGLCRPLPVFIEETIGRSLGQLSLFSLDYMRELHHPLATPGDIPERAARQNKVMRDYLKSLDDGVFPYDPREMEAKIKENPISLDSGISLIAYASDIQCRVFKYFGESGDIAHAEHVLSILYNHNTFSPAYLSDLSNQVNLFVEPEDRRTLLKELIQRMQNQQRLRFVPMIAVPDGFASGEVGSSLASSGYSPKLFNIPQERAPVVPVPEAKPLLDDQQTTTAAVQTSNTGGFGFG